MDHQWFSDCLEFENPRDSAVLRLQRLDPQGPITLWRADGPGTEFKEIERPGSSFCIPVLAALAVDRVRGGAGKKAIQLYDIVFVNRPFETPPRKLVKDRQFGNRAHREIVRLRKLLGPKAIRHSQRGYQLLVPVRACATFTQHDAASIALIGERTAGPETQKRSELQNESNGRPVTRSAPDLYASVPPLPPYYFERPEILAQFRDLPLSRDGALGVTAIGGMGGVGKTFMALGLCHDAAIRQRFPDGIAWLQIGKDPIKPLSELFHEVGDHLGQPLAHDTRAGYRDLLSKKTALIVVDDVWSDDQIEPFRPPAGPSKILFTSRNTSVASLWAKTQSIGVLGSTEARLFLERSAHGGRPLPEPFGSEILDECKGLALALAMLAGALRNQGNDEWRRLLEALRNARLKLIDKKPLEYSYKTLHAAIAIGVSALDNDTKTKYLRLAVLLDEMAAPTELLTVLWGGENHEVLRVVRDLSDRSLVRRDLDGVRLHDLQLDFLRSEFGDPENLALIHAALRRSLHVAQRDPGQFVSQMTGRLMPFAGRQSVDQLITLLGENEPRPRVRLLWPALASGAGADQRVVGLRSCRLECVAISSNGRWLVQAFSGGLIIWDLDSVSEPRTFPYTLSKSDLFVHHVAITPDCRHVVFAGRNEIVFVGLGDGSEPIALKGQENGITRLKMSDDGQWIASISHESELRTWDLTKSLAAHLFGRKLWVGISQNAGWAVSMQPLTLWDLTGQQGPIELQGDVIPNSMVAVSSDGKQIISDSTHVEHSGGGSTSYRRRAVVWNLNEGPIPKTVHMNFEGYGGSSMAISNTGRTICGRWEGIHIRDINGGQRMVQGAQADEVAISDDGSRAVSLCSAHGPGLRGSIIVWDLTAEGHPRLNKEHGPYLLGLAASDDRRCIIAGYPNACLVWDLDGSQRPRVFDLPGYSAKAIALNADQLRAVSFSWDGTVRMWDLGAGEKPRDLGVHPSSNEMELAGVAISRDGKCAISCTISGGVMIWDLEGRQDPKPLTKKPALRATINADGSVAVIGDYHDLSVWTLGEKPKQHLLNVSHGEKRVAISDDGRVAAVAKFKSADEAPQQSPPGDAFIEVWDLQSMTIIRRLLSLSVQVAGVALNHDATRLVAVFIDGTVAVYCLAIGEELCRFTTDHRLTACTWAGGRIVAGDITGAVHLFAFDDATASPGHPHMGHGQA